MPLQHMDILCLCLSIIVSVFRNDKISATYTLSSIMVKPAVCAHWAYWCRACSGRHHTRRRPGACGGHGPGGARTQRSLSPL